MITNSWFIIVSNLVYVLIVLFFVARMLRSASVFNWNPGKNDIQQAQKMKILIGIVVIACVGLLASITNIVFG